MLLGKQNGNLRAAYSYDATGNRTSFTDDSGTSTYQYPVDSHRLLSVDSAARTYDAAGNTVSINGTEREFVYNDTGRMSQVKRHGVVAMNYEYNGKGEQIRRFLDGTSTYFMYDEAGHWLGEYDSAGQPTKQVIWLDDLPVGVVADDKLLYIAADALGAPRTVWDPQRGKVLWHLAWGDDVFGSDAPLEDMDGDGVPFVFDIRFPGQRYDAASGLNYNYFRDYEPGTGRYVESDPIGQNAGPATYAYVSSNPISRIDPFGLTQCTGQASLFGANVRGMGGLRATYHLTSECVSGERNYVIVEATYGSFEIGGPKKNLVGKISVGGGYVSFDDGLVFGGLMPEYVFNGEASQWGVAGVLGLGWTVGRTRLGHADTGFEVEVFREFGIDLGAGLMKGESKLKSHRTTQCGCK